MWWKENLIQFIKEEIQYFLFVTDKMFIPESCHMSNKIVYNHWEREDMRRYILLDSTWIELSTLHPRFGPVTWVPVLWAVPRPSCVFCSLAKKKR